NKPLYTGFRVEEMLRFGARLNPRWDDALARERLACAGVRLEQRVGQLSGGQHAQVALALALGKRPRLLLLDEPVANLDPLARRQFLQTLMEEVATGELTVVLSSHLIEDLDRSCDYLVLLSDSRVQLAGTTERLLAEHRVITGPAEAVAALARQHTVVRPSPPGRVANVLLHLSGHSGTAHTDLGAVHDPSVTVREVSLEDLVLAYMSQPGASAGGPAGLAAVSAVSAVSE
ncbi:MAG: ATP-binding cassette domain-containing protein, partial [Pseudonocardiaceae bacterium]